MSNVSNPAEIQWSAPRSVWVMLIQFAYSLIAMIPLYYYMRIFEDLKKEDYVTMTFFIPIATAVILFMMMILMDDVYWYKEKRYNNRDFFKSAMKSSAFVMVVFFVIFYLIIGFWMNSSFPDYAGYYKNNPLHKFMIDYSSTMIIVIGWSVFRYFISKHQVTI